MQTMSQLARQAYAPIPATRRQAALRELSGFYESGEGAEDDESDATLMVQLSGYVRIDCDPAE